MGAADLVIEVVSPSTRSRDYIRKLGHYESAGVREYWVADPMAAHATVYWFDGENTVPRTYAFDEPVPVGIWEGCSITMGKLL